MENIVINKEELKNKELKEVQDLMVDDLTKFQATCATLSDEDLKALESELMKVFDENDKYIKEVAYEMPKELEFDQLKYTASEIDNKIIHFLNQIEVEWKATLGIYQAISFWKNRGDGLVPYAVFDSTLRLLGTLKFKGMQDCTDILVINNYMSANHDQYQKDTMWVQYIASKHNIIIQALQKQPATEQEDGAPAGEA